MLSAFHRAYVCLAVQGAGGTGLHGVLSAARLCRAEDTLRGGQERPGSVLVGLSCPGLLGRRQEEQGLRVSVGYRLQVLSSSGPRCLRRSRLSVRTPLQICGRREALKGEGPIQTRPTSRGALQQRAGHVNRPRSRPLRFQSQRHCSSAPCPFPMKHCPGNRAFHLPFMNWLF